MSTSAGESDPCDKYTEMNHIIRNVGCGFYQEFTGYQAKIVPKEVAM